MLGALTATQQRVYNFVRDRILIHHLPPTRVEISQHFGWKSPNAAEDQLRALARKGVIVLQRRSARNIQLAS